MSFYAFCAAAVVASSGIARRVGSRIAAAARAVGDAVVGSAVVPVAVVAVIAIVPIAGAVSALRPIRVAEAAYYPQLLDLATDPDQQTTCRTPLSDIPCVRLPEVEVIVTTATAEN